MEQRKLDKAIMLVTSHIEASKALVRQIILHRLHTARAAPAETETSEAKQRYA
ncbi:MAG: hypothetical protein ACM3SS_21785 [Rhodospirillaceae bacterium]